MPDESKRPYDLKRELRELYAAKNREWALLDVPEQQFLAIDGAGNPNTAPEYARAVQALYGVAYTLKFAAKRAGSDFVVAPLEGLWWADTYDAFRNGDKDSWQWTLLICQPAWITTDGITEARDSALRKKGNEAIAAVYPRQLREGLCAQVLHVGSYDDEAPVLADLHQNFLEANNLTPTQSHHEVYLGDPRKTAPEKLKTILRQPVNERADAGESSRGSHTE
ncbi:GyrI-like domain-containing protein [Nocardia callitridis]|uniref:GyrI-like domain-containing protein n=1 Tax=Nocardia callitridis TaxID=648753 RepID=A0ABP9KAS4_9NOCA